MKQGGGSPLGRGPGPAGGPRRSRRFEAERQPPQPKKRMLSMGRKAHFIYDSLEALDKEGALDETRRRGFLEMLFTRGSRQSTEAAQEFLAEKVADETLTPAEADRLAAIVDRYSFRR